MIVVHVVPFFVRDCNLVEIFKVVNLYHTSLDVDYQT